MRQRKQPIYNAFSSRPKTCCASPSPFGKVHAIRRVEMVGGCELSLKNPPRSAASANEFGQPTSWSRTDAPAARLAHVKGRPSTCQRQASPKKIKGAKAKLQQTLGLVTVMRSALPEEIENLPPQSYFRLYTHTAPYPTLFGGHDAGKGHISS